MNKNNKSNNNDKTTDYINSLVRQSAKKEVQAKDRSKQILNHYRRGRKNDII